MADIIMGIDQSMRSTAITSMDAAENVIDFELINAPHYMNGEDLLHFQWMSIKSFIDNHVGFNLKGIALEGAAFGKRGRNDMLWSVQWYIRTRFMVEYAGLPVGIITAAAWRSKLASKQFLADWKAADPKLGLKRAVAEMVPEEIMVRFTNYLEEHKDRINQAKLKDWKPSSKRNCYKEGMWDLCDSWGIAKQRASHMSKKPVLKRRG